MCFCETGSSDLAKTAEGAKAKIDELSATLETDTAEKATLDQELVEHKADREAATKDQAEAQAIRAKESEEYAAIAAESKTNIDALSGAIPALEKGMGGAALMQLPQGGLLRKLIERSPSVTSYDRQRIVAFLDAKDGAQAEEAGDYAPQSGQITGIMKIGRASCRERV